MMTKMKHPARIQAHVTGKIVLPLPVSHASSAPLKPPSSTQRFQALHHHRQHTLQPTHTYEIITIQGTNLNNQII